MVEQDGSYYFIDSIDHAIQDSLQEIVHKDTLELCLIQCEEVDEDNSVISEIETDLDGNASPLRQKDFEAIEEVANFLQEDEMCWDRGIIEGILTPSDVSRIVRIPINMYNSSDALVWPFTSNDSLVRNASKKPPGGWLKCNIDAANFREDIKTGWATVERDSNGTAISTISSITVVALVIVEIMSAHIESASTLPEK
ncbi:hypothetical protein GOBAR_DD16795 [Gossypium barbadense]|nr:hypothetical protein GOBAR_DD16795 [Gossypium barbadense]